LIYNLVNSNLEEYVKHQLIFFRRR